ncbi:DNA double-strand break repair nuclease NurA [Methanolapillus millepedarum]|uniref:NurA domain-containing protein n=1 Tax=Methanolapillus millepedarum TaxID=3028296 RepID=A0AA96V3S3_9EURY|nr:hypothetical protein MsAc7_15810 [Methanosarcinaceae archaeon Ac7]
MSSFTALSSSLYKNMPYGLCMTLEPVHMKEIEEIASGIDYSFTEREKKENLEIFKNLSELKSDGKVILKSIGTLHRFKTDISTAALSEDNFSVTYASDSGSTNPIPFESGLFLDICHCAAAAVPTDLDVQRKRTIVCVGFSPDKNSSLTAGDDWKYFDDGFGRSKTIQIDPALLKKRMGRMVHDMAIYASESEHILWLQKEMNKKTDNAKKGQNNTGSDNSFFMMDGPIYPKQLMYWMGTDSDDIKIRYDKNAQKVLQNYIDIMDFHIEHKIPLAGFVKNPAETQIMNALREKIKSEKRYLDLPWATDSQLFKSFLKNPDEQQNKAPETTNSPNRRKYLTYTNWFLQPNQFYEAEIKENSPLVGKNLSHKFEPDDYSLAFFMIYVPYETDGLLFKIESPYGLIKDDEIRAKITRKMLFELSMDITPAALLKADSVAKIGMEEKKEIKNLFSKETIDRTYNSIRWGDIDDF